MYTILITDQNEMVTTVKERIMQRSKLVDNLHFLVAPMYKDISMADCTVLLEYITPVSREYKTETLVKSDELYKDMLEYKLKFDTCLTKEAGKIEIQLTFIKVGLSADGEPIQQVRKISSTTITIVPIAAWSNIIPDEALTAIDQRLVIAETMIGAANDLNQYLYETKADNIMFDDETSTIQLTANGAPIGDKIKISASTSGISELRIDEDGNLIAVYSNGNIEVIGKTAGSCVGVYVPSMVEDILTFTLSDHATEKVLSFDIEQSNNWSEIEGSENSSNYIWREL